MTNLITIAWQSFVGVCGLALVLTYLHHASRTGADWLARTPEHEVLVFARANQRRCEMHGVGR